MDSIDPEILVADLVLDRPSWSLVFEKHRIDYCCHGHRSLRQACAESGVAVDDVVRDLVAADAPTVGAEPGHIDSSSWSAADMIRHIVDVHHAALRRDLPRLVTLADKVAVAHGTLHPELATLARTAHGLWMELDPHMAKEEAVLFPAIIELERTGSNGTSGVDVELSLAAMEQEHEDVGVALEEVRRSSRDYTPAPEACASWHALASGLRELTAELHRHIHEENNVLHPKARKLAAQAAGTCSTPLASR